MHAISALAPKLARPVDSGRSGAMSGSAGPAGGRWPASSADCLLSPAFTALSLLAAASTCPASGPVRRRVLPGVRSRPVDEPGLQAGYLPEGTAGTRAPQTANGGGPC